jgi:uncharacterized protein (TIGR02611 family)
LRRAVTALVGGTLTLIGVVLLILPGPGFVVIALGLAVLAREFTWAARPLRYATGKAWQGMAQVARNRFAATADALCGLVLVGIAVADLAVNLPEIELAADISLLFGGGFLLTTVVYARRRPDDVVARAAAAHGELASQS